MAETLSTTHLVDKVAENTSVSKKDAKAVVDALLLEPKGKPLERLARS